MTKLFVQDIDWHITENQTGKYLGEVFGDGEVNGFTKIWIKNIADIPLYLKRQVEFGFANVDENGYIIIPTVEYFSLTEFPN
jgi:hypothetical protein